MWLAFGAGLLVSTHWLHRQCQTGLVVTRGGVGMSPGFLACKVHKPKGRAFLRGSPFIISDDDSIIVSRECGTSVLPRIISASIPTFSRSCIGARSGRPTSHQIAWCFGVRNHVEFDQPIAGCGTKILLQRGRGVAKQGCRPQGGPRREF
jgi:hypothetical protein